MDNAEEESSIVNREKKTDYVFLRPPGSECTLPDGASTPINIQKKKKK